MAGSSFKSFKCKSCGNTIEIRCERETLTIGCGNCGSIIDASSSEFNIVQKGLSAAAKFKLPLGAKGRLRGRTYQIIGFIQRSDSGMQYFWSEYLLWNPYYGFRWLTEYNGHWNFVETVKTVPLDDARGVILQGESYRLFTYGDAVVRTVVGEFYWELRINDKVSCVDFIAPPRMLSKEYDASETVWSSAEYINDSEIKAAFGLKLQLPFREGVFANQPVPERYKLPWLPPVAIIVCITLYKFAQSAAASPRIIMQEEFSFPSDPSIRTTYFRVPDGESSLAIKLSSSVDNSWVGSELKIKHTDTGVESEGYVEAAYYHGCNDGCWSEGSRNGQIYITGLDPGLYSVAVQSSGSSVANYSLQAETDYVYWGTYWLAAALLLLPILAGLILRANFERRRWEESSISAVGHEEDDD